MAIEPTTTTPIGSPLPTASTPTTVSKAGMGKDDFLKLLVGQLKNQDPMNPTGSEEFMGQMAQFSTLEQITNVAQATTELAKSASLSSTVGLIGRTVTYTGADKATVTGTVESVDTSGQTPKITIGGKPGIDPAKVTQVR
jgi:flagellar basal-body rod modification protein FlgD